ncbi:MAG: response regulator, partial [Thermoanaerobaculia bacterium]
QNLLGFALAALSLSHSLEASLEELKLTEVEARLVEVGEDGQVVRQLYPPAEREAFGSWSGPLPRPYWTASLQRVGRTWRVEAMPGDGYLTLQRRWVGWSVLGAGVLFTALLGAYLHNLSGRTARVEAMVIRRTEELTGANQRLQSEIVERKRAEDELKTAKDTAEDSEQRTRLIIDTANDAFLTMDAAGAITDWNHQAELTFGWSREEVLGQPLADVVIPVRHREAHWRGLRHFLATGEGPVLGQRIELTGLHRDGHEFPVEITIAAVPLGGTHLFNAFVHDISERKRAEAELRSAKDEAQAATRAKSEFLANMSHEIRTPLNGIIGMTELVLDTELDPEQKEYLDLAKSSADHLLAVINDILDFSKIEAGKLELEMLDFDLREALEDAMAMLAARAHKKGLELLDDVAADVPDALQGDLHRLRQVVVNLIGNAIKFTEQGEVVLRVERDPAPDPIDPVPDGDWLHFSVRDTGIGISPEQQTRMFQAFTQADTSTTRKYGGTGLGLAISARIVERMGGRIWLESEPGRGSTFHFTARFGRARAAPTLRAVRAELRDLRVLVVDDNATNRRILQGMLSNWGMRPTLADGGRAALSALERAREEGEPFAVILLDAMMPEMDGFTLAEQIKLGSQAGATLMMLSSAGRREDAERCRALGVAAFLGKPIRQSILLDALMTALAPAPGEAARLEEPALRPSRPSLRLLLAEDNVVNQRLAMSLLEKRGHHVVAADNGREALAALSGGTFDAVLMDVQMPEMDGLEATAAIRAGEQQSGAHIPIIAMTAHAMKGDRERCLA